MFEDRGSKSPRRASLAALAAFAAVGAFLFAACGAGGTETVSHTFQVGDSPRLVLGAGHGEVLVQTGAPGEIAVNAVVEATANVTLEVEAEGDEVTARATTRMSGNLLGDTAQGNVNFTITVPAQTEIEIGTGSGPVTVTGVQRGGVVTASAGTVTLRDVAGEFSGGTGVGDLLVSGRDLEVDFAVGVGNIDLTGLLRSGGRNRLETGVGDVNVAITGESGFDIEGSVKTGSITSDFETVDMRADPPVTGGRISGRFGDGSADLAVDIGVGSLFIRDARPEPARP